MLTDTQLDRYARHIVLKEIGGPGQMRLLDSHVLVIGAGGLGVPVVAYLAAAGVGRITLYDADTVSLSNLQRQILYREDDIGRPKVDCARDFVAARNKDVVVAAHYEAFTVGDKTAMIDADCVVDCTDQFSVRLMINDLAVETGTPLISAAIQGFEGQVATFRPADGPDLPCYRCFLPVEPPEDMQATCSDTGILGTVAGMVGTLQAQEVIKQLLGLGKGLEGSMLLLDALSNRQRLVKLPRDPACPCCGSIARKGV